MRWKKPNVKQFLIGAILGIGFISVLFCMFFVFTPNVSDKKQVSKDVIKKIRNLGDNASDPENATVEAFNYWYAPENSFGIQETKTVNWSWFWKVFKKNCKWQLEAWHPVQEVWVSEWNGENLNSWLNITKVRNESTNASEKITLNVTNEHPSQDLYFRFKFGINLKVKQYVNKSIWYEYELTYPANETENYTVFFNFSDVKQLIQSGTIHQKHGIKTINGKDFFYFILTQNKSRDPLKSGKSFEIDPIFGNTGDTVSNARSINDVIRGRETTCPSSGTTDNITVYLNGWNPNEDITCAIYQDSNDSLIGTSEERISGGAEGWHVFDITVSITNQDYYLCAWSNSNVNMVEDGSTWERYYKSQTYGTYPDPFDGTKGSSSAGNFSIYCSYTESGGEPTWTLVSNDKNGSWINTTIFQLISNDKNGEWTNTSAWYLISNDINGVWSNTSAWYLVSNDKNGQWTNTTGWVLISSDKNGQWTNTSVLIWYLISSDKNGVWSNTSAWYLVSNDKNGEWTNTTTFQLVSNNKNGSWTNTTIWELVSSDKNGTWTNISVPVWHLVSNDKNGQWSNTTIWNLVSSDKNGTWSNTSAWYLVSNDKNGVWSNDSLWYLISNDKNGQWTNGTSWVLISNDKNGSWVNDTVIWDLISSNKNGQWTNYTVVWVTISNPYPSNNSSSIPLQPIIFCMINHTTSQQMNVSWFYGLTQGNENILFGTDSYQNNGTVDQTLLQAVNRSTAYYWRIQVDDETNYVNESFFFTTEYESIPMISTGNNYFIVFAIIGLLGLFGAVGLYETRRRRRY